MPFTTRDGCRLYWREDGRPTAPPLLLLNSLGTDHTMWDAILPLVAPHFRVLRMDSRGHAASDAPPGDYTIPMLAEDALAVLDAAGVPQAHVCGLSMGGMALLHLAETAPDRLHRAIVANSTAQVPAAPWEERAAGVRARGMAAMAEGITARWVTPAFRATDPWRIAAARATLESLDPEGYAACCMAISRLAVFDALPGITTPMLVINGAADEATPPATHGDRIVAAVPRCQVVSLPAGHLAAIERPAEFAAAILAFLAAPAPDLADARDALFTNGVTIRKSVLGAAWVEKSLANRNAFSGEFQEFITRYAWGEIWGRPGLDHRTRRMLVLAITVALGRWEEFRLHVRAGLEAGSFTTGELKEVLMQAAVYAGVPAANTAFHHAEAILLDVGGL